MQELEVERPRPWSKRRQEVGAILWSSFLAACLGTLCFFAVFDPLLLGNDEQPPVFLSSSMTGYAIGFFFFWFVTAVAALLTAYLLDTIPDRESGAAQDMNRREPASNSDHTNDGHGR